MQDFAAVKDNHELKQRAKKPKVSISDNGEMQCAIRADNADLLQQIAKNVETEFPGRIGGRNARDGEACRQPNESTSGENEASIKLSSMKTLSQQRADHSPGNNRDESRQFKNAIAPGQQLIRKHFRKQAVFRGAKESSLCAREKNHGKGHTRAAVREGIEREKHRENLEYLRGYRDGPFAEAVRQVAAGHGKQQERHGKQISDVENQEILL